MNKLLLEVKLYQRKSLFLAHQGTTTWFASSQVLFSRPFSTCLWPQDQLFGAELLLGLLVNQALFVANDHYVAFSNVLFTYNECFS